MFVYKSCYYLTFIFFNILDDKKYINYEQQMINFMNEFKSNSQFK